jgi:hypothetical protein
MNVSSIVVPALNGGSKVAAMLDYLARTDGVNSQIMKKEAATTE